MNVQCLYPHYIFISLYLTSGAAKSAVKHSAANKPNQQISDKEGKGKKEER